MRLQTRLFAAAIACLAALAPLSAEARPRHHVPPGPPRYYGPPGPHVVIRLDPWVVGYRPDPRPGWTWVSGHYDEHNTWIPGYWAPLEGRPGMEWVPGHWEGPTYVEGHWREAARPGWAWIEGYYADGHWVEGHWEAAVAPPPPPAPAIAPPPPAVAPATEDAPLAIPASDAPSSSDVHHDY